MGRFRAFLALALLAAVMAAGAAVPAQAAPKRPNVLVIVTDDQRAEGTMAVMPKTRRAFGRNGTTYTNAWSTTPLCCPGRASIFTGMYAHNHGVFYNDAPPLMNERDSFVRILDRAGYRTGLVGKYLLNQPIEQPPGHFDRYWLTRGGYYASEWNMNGDQRTVGGYSTDFTSRTAEHFIRHAGKRRPWFLYVAPTAAHFPLTPEPDYALSNVGPFPDDPATEEVDLSDKPPFLNDLNKSIATKTLRPERVRRLQLRTLRSVDDMVGNLFSTLADTGQRRRTLAIFTSDNGLLWGEHGDLTIKDLPYPASARVPLFATWPGHIRQGHRDHRFSALLDIAPTITDATDLRAPGTFDGRSLIDRTWNRDHLLLEYGGLSDRIPSWSGLVYREVQYTQYAPLTFGEPAPLPPAPAPAGPYRHPSFREYYDLTQDPFQLRNPFGTEAPEDDPPLGATVFLDRQLLLDSGCAGESCP